MDFLKKFSHWLSYQPPSALSVKGWRLFNEEFKNKAPFRYWFKELSTKALSKLHYRLYSISDWIRYRTYDRYHVIHIGLPPSYYGADQQILHANFTILKDFVEVELAWMSYIFSEERKHASFFEKYLPLYRVFFPFRSREKGLDHLNWAATLDDPSLPRHERCDHQAVIAREIRELYLWWVDIFTSRKLIELPEYNYQGCDMGALDDDFDSTAPDYKKFIEIMDLNEKLREDWENEDTDMLIRLMKIRKQLWI